MDDYGFVVENDYGSVSISSVYKVLVFSERGQFRIQLRFTDKPGKGQFNFAKPILTVEPPQIFCGRYRRHTTTSVCISQSKDSQATGPGFMSRQQFGAAVYCRIT